MTDTPAAKRLDPAPDLPLDPSASRGVEWIETHISIVLLTAERVYKFRKPVRLAFLSFETREQRNADCAAEVALNRRISPAVYLGVAPLLGGDPDGDPTEIGEIVEPEAIDPALEYCTVMQRLAPGRDAKSLLERGELGGAHIDRVVERLADFHDRVCLGRPAPLPLTVFMEGLRDPIERSIDLARAWPADRIARERVDRLGERFSAVIDERAQALAERHERGRIVDGHGDLHLEHVWFDQTLDSPQIIDCLEFDDRLRGIDVAADLAFFAMDLEYRGAFSLAQHFLARYAERTDDFHLFEVVDLHLAHRSLVRGTVAALTASGAGADARRREAAWGSAIRHFELADRLLEGPRRGGCVVLCGTVGCGKSTVGEALARTLDATLLSSDRTRKHVAGRDPTQRFDPSRKAEVYSEAGRDSVYEALFERAASVVGSGRPVVLDATFSSRVQRKRARDFASRTGTRCVLLEIICDPRIARSRLRERALRDDDPSDAGPERLEASIASFEPPDEWAPELRFSLRTDREAWRTEVRALSGSIAVQLFGRTAATDAAK